MTYWKRIRTPLFHASTLAEHGLVPVEGVLIEDVDGAVERGAQFLHEGEKALRSYGDPRNDRSWDDLDDAERAYWRERASGVLRAAVGGEGQ